MRVSGLPLFVVRAAGVRAAGVRAALATQKRVVSFIITKILFQSKYLFAHRLEMFIRLAAQV